MIVQLRVHSYVYTCMYVQLCLYSHDCTVMIVHLRLHSYLCTVMIVVWVHVVNGRVFARSNKYTF